MTVWRFSDLGRLHTHLRQLKVCLPSAMARASATQPAKVITAREGWDTRVENTLYLIISHDRILLLARTHCSRRRSDSIRNRGVSYATARNVLDEVDGAPRGIWVPSTGSSNLLIEELHAPRSSFNERSGAPTHPSLPSSFKGTPTAPRSQNLEVSFPTLRSHVLCVRCAVHCA
jgi:hypothetical protein